MIAASLDKAVGVKNSYCTNTLSIPVLVTYMLEMAPLVKLYAFNNFTYRNHELLSLFFCFIHLFCRCDLFFVLCESGKKF